MSGHVKIEAADGVMTLTLQRPEKKNALSGVMYDALSDAVRQAEVDASVRVVLFQGDGDSFTAGNDLAGPLWMPPKYPRPIEHAGRDCLRFDEWMKRTAS